MGSVGADDLGVRLELKRLFSDGTFALDLDPLSLVVRLATTVPPRSCGPWLTMRGVVSGSTRALVGPADSVVRGAHLLAGIE